MGRSITHSLVRTLRGVPDFADLDDDVLLEVVGASASLIWNAGRCIFEPGEEAEALYVILRGRVRITADGEDPIAVLEAGDYFGEESLLLHTGHARRAETVEDSELLVIPRAGFEELLQAHPSLAADFRRTLERRIRERDEAC